MVPLHSRRSHESKVHIMLKSSLWKMIVLVVAGLIVLQGNVFAEEAQFEPLEDTEEFAPLNTEEITKGSISETIPVSTTLHRLKIPFLVLLLTLAAGLIVRYGLNTTYRPLFLLGSLVFFGFYNGGCPCILGSFQNVFLFPLGGTHDILRLILFPGIVLLTILFGKVFCGWVCHLGALQEFIYKSNRLNFLKSTRAQSVLRVMRYALFTALVIQLFITRENLFEQIDPFRIAFNMTSRYPFGWFLLGLLLLTSLFIYRPFCNGACPVGLVLGFIEKVPWAVAMHKNSNCTECGGCTRTCSTGAISNNEAIKQDVCIMCGECIETCKHNGILPSTGKYENPQAASAPATFSAAK